MGKSASLPKVKRDDPITAEWANLLIDAVNRSRLLIGQNCGIDAQETPFGVLIRSIGRKTEAQLAKTSSAITARSGTTPGTGTATLQQYNGSAIAAAPGDDITVYNYSATAGGIATAKYCWVAADPYGYYWIVSVEC